MANSNSTPESHPGHIPAADEAPTHNRDCRDALEQILATAHSITETTAMSVMHLEHAGELETDLATALRQSIKAVGDQILRAMTLADDMDLPAHDAQRAPAPDELQPSAH